MESLLFRLTNNFCALSICLGVATHRVRSPLFVYKSTNNKIKTLEKTKNVYVALVSSISILKMREYLLKDKLMLSYLYSRKLCQSLIVASLLQLYMELNLEKSKYRIYFLQYICLYIEDGTCP